MTLRVAVDFGTSSTCVALSVNNREPQVVVVDGHPLLSSAIYAAPDGTVFVGQEADRQAALDPARYEPHPKRRIDESELLLGDTVLPVASVFRKVLDRAVSEARRVAAGAHVDQLVLTHPADWGGTRTQVLRQSATGLATRIALVPEPVAAAVFHSASFPAATGADGRTLAVLDLGGGTVDVSVVRTQPGPVFTVLATKGDPSFGGADIDQLLMEHIGALVSPGDPEAWRSLVEGRDLPDRRRRRALRQDIRGAKETLSRHTYTDVPLPPPFPDAHLTRDDLERLIADVVGRAVDLTLATIHAAGLTPTQLAGIFLVGGSSRIPLVARLIAERTGVVPVTLDQPETVVARGALRAVTIEPDHTGVLSSAHMGQSQAPNYLAQVRALDHLGAVQGRAPGMPGAVQAGAPDHTAHGGGVFAAGSPPPGAHHPPSGPLPPARLATWPGAAAQPPLRHHSGPLSTDHPTGRPETGPRSTRARRVALLVGAGVAMVAAAVAVTLVVVLNRADPADPGRVIAQYDYRFSLPQGWVQTGGNPNLRRTELKPTGAEQGDDVVLVEEKRLSFDSDTDRARAVDKLRRDFESGGDEFSGFTDSGSFAGRDVVYYRERLADKDATVDWYVIFQGAAQVSVGCQHTPDGRDRVQRACDTVVRSMVVTV
ncbi:type VII secretion-associated protein [Actinokineospora iranica]|uniref:Type VII secretion-associated protein, Rv3446c family, C-terminal domain-containing protein n=1 Tax=Actinokineospora iranica TaxID=1271860 RepID=A0A1G6V2G2_9PSEU|nr:type VII secretion-associated protein [Actinokineospora iranica]SDD47800.1 type VII secretion-associated protein, Rv3446c family, C-terminal domain-containing protein [Actinokineospora iranica]